MLKGEDGVSQTKELQAPGCTLFRRNSQDTFIISAADSLGAVWGVQIWHDNSGPSPSWYLKQVEVSEMSQGPVEGHSWLFMGQCWLAVNKDDGRVERTLQVCAKGIGFAKMLRLKLSDYLADYHLWISVHSCPHPNSFTHTQRLSVSLLLLLGYATVNTSIISQMDDWSPFDLGIIDASAISVAVGVLSVLTVLPVVAVISSLFRLREVKFTGSEAQQIKGRKTEKDCFEVIDSSPEPPLFWIQLWSHEVWRKKYLVTPQGSELLTASGMTMEAKSTDKEVVRSHSDNHTRLTLLPEGRDYQEPLGKTSESLSESNRFHGTQRVNPENTDPQGKLKGNIHYPSHSSGGRGLRPVSHWCHYLAWTLCLLLSLSCLVFSAVVGTRFSSSKALLWMHAFFFSLISCFFLIQPVMITTVAVILSFWYRKRADFHSFSIIKECLQLSASHPPKEMSYFAQDGCSYLEKLLRVRQRARYLRLVRPPAPAELRKTRRERRREALLLKTVRDLFFYGCMLFLMLCINHNSSYADHYHLKNAIRKQYISRGHNSAFMSIQKQEDWWKWAQTSLLNLLYKNASDAAELHILVGEPVLWKMEVSSSFHSQVSSATVLSETLRLFLSGNRTSPHPQLSSPMAMSARMCGQLGCYIGPTTTMSLGHTKSDAVSKLKVLRSGRFLEKRMVVLKIKFTLFSPAPNLFTTVTMLTEHNPTGVLQPSAEVQSVQVYRTPAVWDYVVMVYQLLFLLFSLLQLCDQVQTLGQQGIVGYWRTPCNWLGASLLSVTLVYYIYYIHHSAIILEVVDLLQRHDHVDVSHLATCEQHIRALRGVTLFLLFLKCVTVLRVNRTMATSAALLSHSLSNLFWPTISGLILMVALSHMGNLLFSQSSKSFSTLSNSIQTLLCHHCGRKTVTDLPSSWSAFILHRVLCLSCTAVFTAVVIGVVSSSVTSARRSQSRGNVFTVGQLVSYIRQRVTDFPGKHRKLWSENRKEEKTYYFEEFESLLDELLFRLNALSNSLHHMLPPKAHHYREDSPIISPIPPNMDTQEFVRTQMTEERFGEIIPASHLPQSKPELEVPPFLQQRAHSGDISFSGFFVAVDNTQQYKRRGGGNSKNKELQANFKQAGQWANPNDSCCLSKHQAAHTEVVVEVLVHKDPM